MQMIKANNYKLICSNQVTQIRQIWAYIWYMPWKNYASDPCFANKVIFFNQIVTFIITEFTKMINLARVSSSYIINNSRFRPTHAQFLCSFRLRLRFHSTASLEQQPLETKYHLSLNWKFEQVLMIRYTCFFTSISQQTENS